MQGVLSEHFILISKTTIFESMKWFVLAWFALIPLSSFSQVVINEICAANADINIDPDFFNYSGWIELYNAGNNAVDLSGYFLSDNPAEQFKWQLPAGILLPSKGFVLIWCDQKYVGLHAGFSLSADGETLVLSNPVGVVIDLVTFPSQFTNMSYARAANNSWRITPFPSPQAANIQGPSTSQRLDPPAFSKSGGRYSGTQTIKLSHPQKNVTIRFTTDGSEPLANSNAYSSPVTLSSTKVLKAKAFHPDFLPGETVSNTYLINEHTSPLPIVSISTKPDYLWDNTIGIYADGTNGIPGNCNGNPMNWNQDWSRHAVFEYFDASGNPQVQQAVDIRIGGACSRNFPQKSFVIQARKKYGSNEIQYPFFSTKKNVKSFGGLFLRNSGNDFNTTMFRDAFIQSLGIGKMDLDYMAYQPTVFYLNGEYWGIQNLREKIDGDFIESNYGIDKNDVDLLETYENAIEGTSDAWRNYKDSLQLLPSSDPNTFAFISKHIDVQEYINYVDLRTIFKISTKSQVISINFASKTKFCVTPLNYLVTEIYVSNTDWPGNNVKFWRQRSTNGKFRWILWDTDFGFALYPGFTDVYHPTLNFVTDPNQTGWPNPAVSTLHIRLVLQNPEFRNRFIATFATAMGTTFHPDRVNQMIDEFSKRIESEVPEHKIRWGGFVADWVYEILRLRYFANVRHPFMQGHVANFFGLGQPIKFSVSTSPPAAAKIEMNGIRSDGLDNAPYYKGVPYRVKPIANAGFRFTDWTITTRENDLISLANAGTTWKYFDQGTLPDAAWNSSTFDDAGWAQGNAQLGYGEGDEITAVGFGPDPANKFITTYFRKSFSIADTTGLTNLSASILFDDGVVVYLNGTEVFRNNLPAGSIANATLALQATSTENTFYPFTINKNLLKPGVNTFAVEVHQVSGQSSDISFDFSASTSRIGNSVTYTTNDLEVYDTAFADVVMVANFDPIAPVEGLVLNEFSANKSFVKDNYNEEEDWIELHNAGSSPIDISSVLITDDLSIKDKHTLSNNGSPWVLQPGTYQLLWADDQLNQGKEHLPFKLSADGEQIGVYHVAGYDTLVIASIRFGSQPDGFSMARIPNATGPFELTSNLTPGAANESGNNQNYIYPNPADLEANLVIFNESTSVTIYDLMGKRIRKHVFSSPGEMSMDTSDLANGVYVVKILSSKINSTTRLVVTHQ